MTVIDAVEGMTKVFGFKGRGLRGFFGFGRMVMNTTTTPMEGYKRFGGDGTGSQDLFEF